MATTTHHVGTWTPPAKPVLKAIVRIVLWPTCAPQAFDDADTSVSEATADERQHFAEHYGNATVLELMRRLRTAEWNADYYRGEYEAAVERHRAYPPMYRIHDMDVRHKRVRALLDTAGRRTFTKAELRAVLEGPLPEADNPAA